MKEYSQSGDRREPKRPRPTSAEDR